MKIAFRNIFRNSRRSLMTVLAIAVGAASLLLFGEFIENIMLALQTNEVMQSGHVSVFKKGFYEYGAGNPGAYGIKDYSKVLEEIRQDPEIKDLIRISTTTVVMFGIAGNAQAETSKTFFAIGVEPKAFNDMRLWDEHHMPFSQKYRDPVMSETELTHGIIGVGMAKILGLCERLGGESCVSPYTKEKKVSQPSIKKAEPTKPVVRDFSALSETVARETTPSQEVKIDLLAGTASGAPNVVSLVVDKAVPQGAKEYDDAFIGMNIALAQQLLYGRGEKMVSSIVLQLHSTKDMLRVRDRIRALIEKNGWDLEVKDLEQLKPFYTQSLGMFRVIFTFIAAIMAIIVLFTVINTMGMSVMERTQEIGTLRALGVKKLGITRQFVLEGVLLGVIGSTLGVLFGSLMATLINHSGFRWLPPGQADSIPLMLQTTGVGMMIFTIWAGLAVMATIASWFPAKKAAELKIVDALGHV